jgi:hypothetical protein
MNGLPEREGTRCKEYKAMSDRGDATTSDVKRGVSSIQVSFADPPSAKQEAVDIDVEDVQRHMLLAEAPAAGAEYMLKIHEPFLSSITAPLLDLQLFASPADDLDIEDSLPAETGTPTAPPPEPIVTDLVTPPPATRTSAEPSIAPPPGHHWWHVDTGATDACTNRMSDLLAPIPTNQPIGTAAVGSQSTIEAVGSMTLSATAINGQEFLQSLPQVLGVPSFARRSCSPHAFRALGYEAIHSVGKYLRLIHLASGIQYEFPIHIMHGNTDFIALRINAVTDLPTTVTHRVSAINLSDRLKGASLFYLLHFRFGCLSPAMMEILIKRGALKGVPVTLRAPADFQCPICLVANATRAISNPGQDQAISIKGSRFHADFVFPKTRSVRGYVAILLIVEPVSSHGWVFLRRSKHPPIQILVWFITHLRRRLQLAFSVLRTDGGGELYGSQVFRAALAQIHCQTETTGGYNAAANGPPETAGGLIKRTMRCLLVMGNRDPTYWCFAAPFAQMLENIRPRRKENFRSSHAGIYGKEASYDHLRILFSMIYILVSRASRRRQDPLRRATPGLFLGYQGTGRVLIYRDEAQHFRYAHHAVIDELQSALEPTDRSPAARFLHNLSLDIPFRDDLTVAINELEVTPSRWTHAGLTSETLPNLGPNGELGLQLAYSETYSRCKIIGLVPDSPASLHLQLRQVVDRFLLTINGATVRTVDDVMQTLASIHSIDIALNGVLLLLGKPTSVDSTPEDLNFVPTDGNTQRAVWSIATANSPHLQCPSSFRVCMRGPYRQAWLDALFKHLDSNAGYGTFADPSIPPTNACILDGILAIKHKLDEHNRLVERKLRLCAHGGQQIAGLDYDESYAPAILATSFRLTVVMACHLGVWLFHLDVSNAFQSTPDRDPKTFLRCFPEYLLWFESRFPAKYAALRKRHPTVEAHDLAMLMLKYVQGRVDASLQWKHAIEEVLIDELGLVPNRADSCVYTGRVEGELVFISRATDDFLVGSTIKGYRLILKMLRFRSTGEKRWEIHDYGLATYFFGIRILQSVDAITIDQRPFSRATLAEVFGTGWEKQPPSVGKHLVPLPAGSAYEARLAGETPASPAELKALEQKFGFKFRTILGKFMQLTSWTRLDLVTATIRMSQYQSSPGPAHFEGLHKMLLYLLAHPDHGLTYTRKNAILPLERHPQCPSSPPSVNPPTPMPNVASFAASVPASPLDTSGPPTIPFSFDYSLSQSDSLGDPIVMTHEPTSADEAYAYETIPTMQVPRVASINIKSAPVQSCDSTSPITVLTPPPIEGEMDANHGSVFETIGFTGLVLISLGTAFYYLSQKQATAAYNTAESELYAATTGGKTVKWTRVWLEDFGVPLMAPVPMGEDNEATRIIAHAGKLTRNVRHIAIQTTELQSMVKLGIMALLRVGSADNRADHFTKLLPPSAFIQHTTSLMGVRFITAHHAAMVARRNLEKK